MRPLDEVSVVDSTVTESSAVRQMLKNLNVNMENTQMFKRIALSALMLASAATLFAFGIPKLVNTSGTHVVSSVQCNVERLTIVSSTGSAVLGIYNATSATGAVAINHVADVTVTATTANLQLDVFGTFTKGLVVSTAGSPETVTAWATVVPYN